MDGHYLGGTASDTGRGIAVDNNGVVYLEGVTYSTDFPTLNQYQTDQGDIDAFVTKIDTTKSGESSLVYSTYLGGAGSDYGYAIAIDDGGNAFVTGEIDSTNFPIRNQYQTDQGGRDAFVTRIDTTKSGDSSLIFSSYLGGTSEDSAWGIAINSGDDALVTGYTDSTDFPIKDQYQTHQGGTDVFVTKLQYSPVIYVNKTLRSYT